MSKMGIWRYFAMDDWSMLLSLLDRLQKGHFASFLPQMELPGKTLDLNAKSRTTLQRSDWLSETDGMPVETAPNGRNVQYLRELVLGVC
jgi:hypothetical protein